VCTFVGWNALHVEELLQVYIGTAVACSRTEVAAAHHADDNYARTTVVMATIYQKATTIKIQQSTSSDGDGNSTGNRDRDCNTQQQQNEWTVLLMTVATTPSDSSSTKQQHQ